MKSQVHSTTLAGEGDKTALPFNINQYVYVRLTDHGRSVHESDHAMLLASMGIQHIKLPYSPPAEDADGWSKWQMWELMREFGQHTGMGREPCFETTIRIDTRSL